MLRCYLLSLCRMTLNSTRWQHQLLEADHILHQLVLLGYVSRGYEVDGATRILWVLNGNTLVSLLRLNNCCCNRWRQVIIDSDLHWLLLLLYYLLLWLLLLLLRRRRQLLMMLLGCHLRNRHFDLWLYFWSFSSLFFCAEEGSYVYVDELFNGPVKRMLLQHVTLEALLACATSCTNGALEFPVSCHRMPKFHMSLQTFWSRENITTPTSRKCRNITITMQYAYTPLSGTFSNTGHNEQSFIYL